MFNEADIKTVYNFLKDTPEGPLKKMLVGPDLTEVHLRLMLKIVRGCSEGEFVEVFNNEAMPKIRLNPAETALKEKFWPACKQKLQTVGLLTQAAKAA